jgi:hypothetical protein
MSGVLPPRLDLCRVEESERESQEVIWCEHVACQIVNASSASGANNCSGSSSSFARPCSCE